MAVVQFKPDLKEGSLADGFVVPRGSPLKGLLGKGETTACEYRTAHDVTLYPLELIEAQYVSRDSAGMELPDVPKLKAAIRIRLRSTAGLPLAKLKLDKLPLFIHGAGELPVRIYEQILAGCIGIAARPTQRPAPWQVVLPAGNVRRLGYDDNESLLPFGPRSFQGYRLLAEYFACPQRFLFVELSGLAAAIGKSTEQTIDLILLLDRHEPQLEAYVGASSFGLFCTPAINLFPKSADRIHLTCRARPHAADGF
jgi:type VI secretion system protein ImpG